MPAMNKQTFNHVIRAAAKARRANSRLSDAKLKFVANLVLSGSEAGCQPPPQELIDALAQGCLGLMIQLHAIRRVGLVCIDKDDEEYTFPDQASLDEAAATNLILQWGEADGLVDAEGK